MSSARSRGVLPRGSAPDWEAILELYTFWLSSAAYRVRIALNLKGLDATHHVMVLRKGDQAQPAYRKLNPQELVPTLVDDGSVLTQSLAILEYLDETHPDPPFLPSDPRDRALVRSHALTVACDIHPLNNLRVLLYLEKKMGHGKDEVDAWYRHWLEKGLNALEDSVAASGRAGKCLFGDTPTVADICLAPQLYNARRFGCDLSACPTLTRVDEHCMALDAFARAAPEAQPEAA